MTRDPLFDRVILRCVIGSRAYGLARDDSDTDRRGVYLPPADLHWSLSGAPQQLQNDATQEVYWEIQKFVTLALNANPNVLECLHTPLVETATPLARELLAMRESFLSKRVYRTYSGYVAAQFRRMQAGLRKAGAVAADRARHAGARGARPEDRRRGAGRPARCRRAVPRSRVRTPGRGAARGGGRFPSAGTAAREGGPATTC